MEITRKDKWALFCYLRPSYWWLIPFFISLLLGIYIIQEGTAFALIVFSVLPCLLFAITPVCGTFNTIMLIKSFEKNGRITNLMRDFHEGVMIGCDHVRMGNTYILGRRTSTIIAYNEITEIYERINTSKGFICNHELRVKIGESWDTLCIYTNDGPSKEEIEHLFSIIQSQNPSVRWGNPHVG